MPQTEHSEINSTPRNVTDCTKWSVVSGHYDSPELVVGWVIEVLFSPIQRYMSSITIFKNVLVFLWWCSGNGSPETVAISTSCMINPSSSNADVLAKLWVGSLQTTETTSLVNCRPTQNLHSSWGPIVQALCITTPSWAVGVLHSAIIALMAPCGV